MKANNKVNLVSGIKFHFTKCYLVIVVNWWKQKKMLLRSFGSESTKYYNKLNYYGQYTTINSGTNSNRQIIENNG